MFRVLTFAFVWCFAVRAVAIARPTCCLWKSQISAILNYEYQMVKNTASGTCILREGRSELMRKFECVKMMVDDEDASHRIETVECKKCLKKKDIWEMLLNCKKSRIDIQ